MDMTKLIALEQGVAEKLKTLAAMLDPMLALAAELEVPIEMLFPSIMPAFKELERLSAGVKAIEHAAPNLVENIAAIRAAAAPLEADIQAIRDMFHPTAA